jgi:hypothetical protein
MIILLQCIAVFNAEYERGTAGEEGGDSGDGKDGGAEGGKGDDTAEKTIEKMKMQQNNLLVHLIGATGHKKSTATSLNLHQ